jgi:sugar diacid utilization regulator
VADHDVEVVRRTSSDIHTLLVLSVLMNESGDTSDILDLAATAAPTLAPCQVAGVVSGRTWRLKAALLADDPALQASLVDQLVGLGEGGPLVVPGWPWAYAYSLRHLDSDQGLLVLVATQEPSLDEQFLLDVLAHQTGFALATSALMRRERETAYELARTNTALSRLVHELQRTVEIHRRLNDAVSAGGGHEGLALALHGLTGFPVALEDRFGNLLAWAPGVPPDPRPPLPPGLRDDIRRDPRSSRKPRRLDGRVVALASSRYDVEVFLSLIDPEGKAGDPELAALEHAATVLALELARLASSAEAELRLGRDLVEDLLAGQDEEAIVRRALALGCDLGCSRRVVIVDDGGRSGDEDDAFLVVCGLARERRVATLSTRRSGQVVLLAEGQPDWEPFRAAVERALRGGRCRLGVGAACESPGGYPRSYREAQLALKLASLGGTRVLCWEDLGIFRFLSSLDDLAGLQELVEEHLGALLRHDEERNANLVETLYHWLEAGGSNALAAEALIVHPSTVKYRIQRVREVGGCDLARPETRFTLQFATRAWHLLQTLGAKPSAG